MLTLLACLPIWEQTYECQRYTKVLLTSILSLLDLWQNHSLEISQVCIVWQCFPQKLSPCFPMIILYKSQIHVMVFSEMNRCSKSGIHEHSPNSQMHIQIFHRIARLCSIDFPDNGEDGFQIVGCVRRYVEVVVPGRFCILLTFLCQLKNWLRVQGVAP